MKNSRKRKAANKKIWFMLYGALVLACLACIAGFVLYLIDDEADQSQRQYESVAEKVVVPQIVIPDFLPAGEKAALPVNFEELQAINPEIYAWIQIPDTKVDYPILQHEGEDQSYYLTRDMYGEEAKAGSIYTEYYNKKDFYDPNTIIYGHNMKNGSMFHNLRYFAQEDFFEEHEDMYIYTPSSILCYKIFASYEYDDRHLLASFDFYDEAVFQSYIEEIMNPRSMYTMLREGYEIRPGNCIVTLSTCVGNKPNSRRLVQAVLVNELPAEYKGEIDGENSEEAETE